MPNKLKAAMLFSMFAAVTLLYGCGNITAKDNDATYPSASTDTTVIGSLVAELSTNYNYIGHCESGLANLVTDTMKLSSGADFAVINAGTVRFRPSLGTGDVLPAGNLTKGDVTNFLPFDNLGQSNPTTVALINLTGVVIKEMFENAFSKMLADGSEGGSFGRFLQVSQTVRVYADVTQPVNSRITKVAIKDKSGNEIETINLTDTVKKYRVAVPFKYISSSPGFVDRDGYGTIFDNGTGIIDTTVYLYDAIINEIVAYGTPLGYADVGYPTCTLPASNNGSRLVITHN